MNPDVICIFLSLCYFPSSEIIDAGTAYERPEELMEITLLSESSYNMGKH